VKKISTFKILSLLKFVCSDFKLIASLCVCGNTVTRVEARSHNLEMFMHLDVNTEVYPLAVGDKFTLAMAPTLNLDGTPDTGYFTPVLHAFSMLDFWCILHTLFYLLG